MKKIYTFIQRSMNGSVTLRAAVCACSTDELARKAREAVIEANRWIPFPKVVCDDVEELIVFESEEEVPILNQK